MKSALADIIAFEGNRDDLYREIGRFVFEYSQLESDLRNLFRSLIGYDRKHADIISTGFDFSRLCGALLAVSAIYEGARPNGEFETIINRCRHINDVRVAVVHGRWSSTYGGDRAIHVAKGSMKPANYFEFEGDLDYKSEEIVRLRRDLMNCAVSIKAHDKPKRRKKA